MRHTCLRCGVLGDGWKEEIRSGELSSPSSAEVCFGHTRATSTVPVRLRCRCARGRHLHHRIHASGMCAHSPCTGHSRRSGLHHRLCTEVIALMKMVGCAAVLNYLMCSLPAAAHTTVFRSAHTALFAPLCSHYGHLVPPRGATRGEHLAAHGPFGSCLVVLSPLSSDSPVAQAE